MDMPLSRVQPSPLLATPFQLCTSSCEGWPSSKARAHRSLLPLGGFLTGVLSQK